MIRSACHDTWPCLYRLAFKSDPPACVVRAQSIEPSFQLPGLDLIYGVLIRWCASQPCLANQVGTVDEEDVVEWDANSGDRRCAETWLKGGRAPAEEREWRMLLEKRQKLSGTK